MEKKEKRGFWASLFPPKPCKCSREDVYFVPTDEVTIESAGEPREDSQAVKEIKVLGPGCAKCKSTFAVVEKVVKSNGIDARLTKVDDIEEIMRYNILATPAVVVDGQVMLKGKVPTEAEVKKILGI